MKDFRLVGFADDPFEPRDFLLLQRSYEDDEQDSRLGMNTYHVERNGQLWSCYGGIERFKLCRDRVKVSFTKEGSRLLGNVPGMEITFNVEESKFNELQRGLRQVFAATGCLVGITC